MCRLWRDVALSYPFLWTAILLRESLRVSFNTLAQVFLSRSRGKPVRLYVVACRSPQIKHEIDWRLRQLLQQAIPRATEVHVHLMRNTDLAPFWSTFAAPARSMFSFRVVCNPAPQAVVGNRRHRRPHVDVIPKSGLFLDSTPKLRSVRIQGASLSPVETGTPKLLLHKLQSVELAEDPRDTMKPTPMHHLQATASTLTALTIRSHNTFPAVYPDSFHPIEFPRLQRLDVSSASAYAVEVLRWATVPQTTGIRIDLFQHMPGWACVDPAAAVRREHWGIAPALVRLMAASPPIRAISVTPTGDMGPRFFYSFWTEIPRGTLSRCPDWNTVASPPRLSFANAVKTPPPSSGNVGQWCDLMRPDTAELFSCFPLASCRILHLHQIPTDTSAWEGDALVTSATSLHTVEAWGDMAAKALITLLDPPSEETLSTRLSSLRTLRFVGLTASFRGGELVHDLARVSARRAARKLAALDVHFPRCEGVPSS